MKRINFISELLEREPEDFRQVVSPVLYRPPLHGLQAHPHRLQDPHQPYAREEMMAAATHQQFLGAKIWNTMPCCSKMCKYLQYILCTVHDHLNFAQFLFIQLIIVFAITFSPNCFLLNPEYILLLYL